MVVDIPVVPAQPQPLFGRLSRQIILGEIGAVARRVGIGAEDGDAPFEAETAELVGAGKTGGASADNDDLLDMCAGASRLRAPFLDSAPDEGAAAFDLHGPALDRVQRGRSKHGAGAKVEAGMVERAADSRAACEALAEIAAIMGAGSADREQLSAEARQKNGVVTDAARDRAFGGDFAERDALREIRSRCAGCFAHLMPSFHHKMAEGAKGFLGREKMARQLGRNRALVVHYAARQHRAVESCSREGADPCRKGAKGSSEISRLCLRSKPEDGFQPPHRRGVQRMGGGS